MSKQYQCIYNMCYMHWYIFFEGKKFLLIIRIITLSDTTDVQTPTLRFKEESRDILLVCDFAIGSKASGCSFRFMRNTNSDPEQHDVFRDSKEKSTQYTCGDSQACKCVTAKHNVTSYSTIEVYTLEEYGKRRSGISVPSQRVPEDDGYTSSAICTPQNGRSIKVKCMLKR